MDVGALGVYVFIFLGLYFEVFMLITFLEKRPEKKTSLRPVQYPSVAIIVPCWNEERTLASTLKSLLALEYPRQKLSIIVVDDGSRDNTLAIAERFARHHPQVRTLSKENGGKYTALNLGIANTDAELVGCLDADSFVTQDALIESVKKFQESADIMAVIPAMQVHQPRRPLELMQTVEYTFGIFYKKMFGTLGAISVLPGPFSIYRRDVFERVGPFRHAYQTEDMEMAFRMQEHGLRIENAHTAVVYTKVPRTVRALLRQRKRWSQGFIQNTIEYRRMLCNSRYGHFGTLSLPLGFVLFFGALYTAGFTLWHIGSFVMGRVFDHYTTQVPWQLPLSAAHFSWFYLNTNMLTMLTLMMAGMTLFAILVGRRIADANFGIFSLLSYFLLYGFLAPVWLARAAWGAARWQEAQWR